MKSTIESKFDKKPSTPFLRNLIDFIESDGTSEVLPVGGSHECRKLVTLIFNVSEDPEILLCIDYVILHCARNNFYEPFFLLASKEIAHSRLLALAKGSQHQLDIKLIYNLAMCAYSNQELNSPADPKAPFKFALANLGWNQSDADLLAFLATQSRSYHCDALLQALLLRKPTILKQDLENKSTKQTAREYIRSYPVRIWEKMLEHSDLYDQFILDPLSHYLSEYKQYELFDMFVKWSAIRNDIYLPQILSYIKRASYGSWKTGIELRRQYHPDDYLPEVMTKFVDSKYPEPTPEFIAIIQQALDDSYLPLLDKLTEHQYFFYLPNLSSTQARTLADLISDKVDAKQRVRFWEDLIYGNEKFFIPEAWKFISDSSKKLRTTAADLLTEHDTQQVQKKLPSLIASKKSAERLAAIELLIAENNQRSQDQLLQLLTNKITKTEQETITTYLNARQIKIQETLTPQKSKKKQTSATLDNLIAQAQKAKTIKLPKGTAKWLSLTDLPAINTSKTKNLDTLTVEYIFLLQTRNKDTRLAQKLNPLTKIQADNHPFAHALLDQWLASPMSAKEKWVMPIIGVFGDDHIIPRLVDPMETWAEANRGKRGVWAIDAIALIGTEMALQTLYELTQTYRAKRRYLASAAQDALNITATQLGITEYELNDRIIPKLGFDSQSEQTFETTRSSITAILQSDFKIFWKRNDQLTKTTPSNLTDSAKLKLKDIRATLRKTKKLQLERLKLALIEQRKWQSSKWKELFLKHPLLSHFTPQLIWSIYDSDKLTHTFRVYENGIIADHSGNFIDISNQHQIALTHPIEISETDIKEWQSHFTRNKVKPLFPQLKTSIHPLNKRHSNRKKIATFTDQKITAGAFIKTAKKHGYTPSAVGDGGRIDHHKKHYPVTAITAYLLSDLYAFTTYDETITILECHFTQDAEIIPLSQVPATIYSDVITCIEDLRSNTNT